jgi:hypothetical protein
MIKLSSSKLILSLCLVLFIGLVSCNKNDDPQNDGKVVLYSFGPTGAKHGDTLKFIGVNLDKVSSIKFTGEAAATVDKKDFKSQSSQQIQLIVPAAAEKGYVTLKTPEGELLTKTQLNLNVLTTITAITPQARPGENVTITGNYLNWVDRVTFARDKVVSTFITKNMNQLVVTIPADAQTGPLVLHYGGTDSSEIQTTDTIKVTLPVATALSPNPIKHKTNLTITGTNLDLAKQVLFTGVSSPITSFVSQSATQLVVEVPSGAQAGKITLVAASGVKSISAMDLNVMLPTITSLSPNPIDPEANLTITGTNLDLVTGISFVGIANQVKSFVSQSATQIVVKIPAGVLKGKLTFSVLNSTLTVQSDELKINGGLPPLADFPFAIYTDGTQNGFQNWSWAANDFNSTANVRQGTKSIKATYGGGGYEGITFHNDNGPATTGYTKLEFSVFGEAGTNGKKLNVVINGGWSNPPQVTIAEGEWKTFSLDISSLPNPNPLKEIVLQSAGWGGVIHIDNVGLR